MLFLCVCVCVCVCARVCLYVRRGHSWIVLWFHRYLSCIYLLSVTVPTRLLTETLCVYADKHLLCHHCQLHVCSRTAARAVGFIVSSQEVNPILISRPKILDERNRNYLSVDIKIYIVKMILQPRTQNPHLSVSSQWRCSCSENKYQQWIWNMILNIESIQLFLCLD